MANPYYGKTYTISAFTKARANYVEEELDALEVGFDSVDTDITAIETSISLLQTGSYLTGTSTSTVSIGTGNKTFTVETNRAWTVGTKLSAAYDTDNYMEGIVSSYSGTTLVLTVVTIVGSGSYSSWNIGLNYPVPVNKALRHYFANL